MFFAKHGGELKDTDAERLSPEDWVKVADVVDMLGPFKPLT